MAQSVSSEFKYLMYLCSQAARGSASDRSEVPIDWKQIIEIAEEQTVLPLLALSVKLSPDLDCPDTIRLELKNRLRIDAFSAHLKTCDILTLLRELEELGVKSVILKGFDAAQKYAYPEARISSDTDILIEKNNEEKVLDFLRAKGFKIEGRAKDIQHTCCFHERYGLVEVHIKLWNDYREEIWFAGRASESFVTEEFPLIQTEIGHYYALGQLDNLVFLAMHTIKHFLSDGMSIRSLLDYILALEKCSLQQNLEAFWTTMQDIGYKTAAIALLQLGVMYCGACPSLLREFSLVSDSVLNSLMNDIEQGGWCGYKDKEQRKSSSFKYTNQLLYRKHRTLLSSMQETYWRLKRLTRAVFPSYKVLANGISWLKNKPYLLPVAWGYRWVVRVPLRLKEGLLKDYLPDNAVDTSERMTLFSDLDLL